MIKTDLPPNHKKWSAAQDCHLANRS